MQSLAKLRRSFATLSVSLELEETIMEVNEMAAEECKALLERASLGRLGCSYENQPYAVPIHFAYDSGYLYVFSTLGQKVKWMRANPKVCVQIDEIQNQGEWTSVIVSGQYEELPEPQYSAERKHASSLLANHSHWWLNGLGERQMKVGDQLIDPLFFRIRIQSMSGLRASDEDEKERHE
jgi:hypothetical protein